MQSERQYKEIDELIVRYIFCETSQKEDDLLRQWVYASEANRKQFIRLRNTCFATFPLRKINRLPEILRKINILKTQQEKRTALPALSRLSRGIAVAASIAAVVSVILVTGLYDRGLTVLPGKVSGNVSDIEFYVNYGTTATTMLPDGTKIWLNAGSRISYGTGYNENDRDVSLEGEAYFEVVTNPDRPFVVKAKGLEITATGTAFNVSAYKEDNSVVTTLVEGIVTITGKDIDKPILMSPDESVEYFTAGENRSDINKMIQSSVIAESARNVMVIDRTPAIKINSNTEAIICWRDNRWVVESEKLENFIPKVERRYNVSIYFASDEIRNLRLNGSFEGETIEEVMKIMNNALPIDYKVEKGTILIFADKGKQHYFENL